MMTMKILIMTMMMTMKMMINKMDYKFLTCTFFVMLFSLYFGFSSAYAETEIVEDYEVEYEIDGGAVLSIELDSDFIELIIEIDTLDDGILEISIPRELLDAKFNNEDDVFFVLVDGFVTEYLELTDGADSRTILIPFFSGDSQIEIIGTDALTTGIDEIISEPELEIPSWVKSNAGWWAAGQIGDSDFVLGIQYLITEGVMTIPPTEQGSSSTQDIPSWIRNNAEWWSQDQITDSDFISGIQYLISNGVMKI